MFKMRKWAKMKARCDKGEIDIQTFVDTMKNMTLYYSTPFGEDQNGKPQLYVLSSRESEEQYFPAFLSKEQCMRFFASIGRMNFMIIEGNLKDFLCSLDTSPLLAELGAIIEPNNDRIMAVPPGIRAAK